jgi:hypothetical protein
VNFEGDISTVQLPQNLMQPDEGKIPGRPSSEIMRLADKLCHIVTTEWTVFSQTGIYFLQ